MNKKVISIGQCGFDHARISRLLKSLGAEIVKIDLHSEVEESIRMHSPSLILVNRINDNDGSSGFDLIKDLKASSETSNVPVMLVSNYKEAQEEAIKSGALQGFGKLEMDLPQTSELLKQILS